MKPPPIVNLGSLNLDHVYRLPSIVRPGETLGSLSYNLHLGGKGLNQSVALARAGAAVTHVGAVGPDGGPLRDGLRDAGVDVSHISTTETPSGHAIVQVDDHGENAIVLFAGANHETRLDPMLLSPDGWLLTQNETNGVADAIRAARSAGASVAFNPAPMHDDVKDFPLENVNLLIVNQTEAEALGNELQRTLGAGGAVITTLGADGAVHRTSKDEIRVDAERVTPTDTTAAGDTFVGYLLASLVRGDQPETAMRRATRAAAISITRPGAMPSIPFAREVDG